MTALSIPACQLKHRVFYPPNGHCEQSDRESVSDDAAGREVNRMML